LAILQNVFKIVLEVVFFRFGVTFNADKLFYTFTAFFEVIIEYIVYITLATLLLSAGRVAG
jgi:hypothetical protein